MLKLDGEILGIIYIIYWQSFNRKSGKLCDKSSVLSSVLESWITYTGWMRNLWITNFDKASDTGYNIKDAGCAGEGENRHL